MVSLKYRILLITVPIVVALDQWTKHLVLQRFRLGESLPLIDNFFAFTYVRNTGAAFSFLHDAPAAFRIPFFMVVPFIVLSVLGTMFYKLPPNKKWTALAFSLIAGGAFGNVIDRIRLGYVVDFIHVHWKDVYHYPMFNIADSAIVVGVIYLFIESFFAPKVPK